MGAVGGALPGQEFTHDQAVWRRAELRTASPRVWAIDPASGNRIDLTRAEEVAFWTWAAVEVLRHTGMFSRGQFGHTGLPGSSRRSAIGLPWVIVRHVWCT